MDEKIRQSLKIPSSRLDDINAVLLNPETKVINDFLAVVAKYGTPEEINRKHLESRKLENLLNKVELKNQDYVKDLKWLMEMRDKGTFISVADYRKKVLGPKAGNKIFKDESAVTPDLLDDALIEDALLPEARRMRQLIEMGGVGCDPFSKCLCY